MVKINGDLKENCFEIKVKGHAGYAEKGKDIVCSAVSSLCSALWNTAEEYSEMGIFGLCEHEISDGYFRLCCKLTGDNLSRISAIVLLSSFYNGIASVEAQYPLYAKLNKRIMTFRGRSADNDTSEKTMTKGRKGEKNEG